jgi:hypothetical protein
MPVALRPSGGTGTSATGSSPARLRQVQPLCRSPPLTPAGQSGKFACPGLCWCRAKITPPLHLVPLAHRRDRPPEQTGAQWPSGRGENTPRRRLLAYRKRRLNRLAQLQPTASRRSSKKQTVASVCRHGEMSGIDQPKELGTGPERQICCRPPGDTSRRRRAVQPRLSRTHVSAQTSSLHHRRRSDASRQFRR